MNILTFKKSISTLVMVSYTALASLIPIGKAVASPICDISNPTTAANASPGCAVATFATGNIAYPKLQWETLAEISADPKTGIKLSMAQGNRVEVDNNRAAAALNLTGAQVANIVSLFPTNVPFVFARYNPISAEARVEIIKVEKIGGKTMMLRAQYGPGHGGAYAAAMTYASPSDRALGLSPGVNPFAMFMTPGDDTFHNVGSAGAVQVIVGHAMRMAGAPVAMVAEANLRVNQWTSTSGGWFRKTTTQHIDGYTKPKWYIVTPTQFQPRGETYSMCAQNVAVETDCPAAQVVYSGVSWTQWTGGNLPGMEDLTSKWEHSESGFTLLAWIAIAFLVVFTAGAALAAAGVATSTLGPLSAAISAAAPASAAGAVTGAIGSVGLSAIATTAALEAAFVGVVGVASGSGLNDVVQGPYQGAKSGYGSAQAAHEAYEQSLFDGVHNRFDLPAVESGSQLTSVRQGAYGSCPPGATVTACGGSSGVIPRADSGTQQNTVEFWQDNGKPMVVVDPLQAR